MSGAWITTILNGLFLGVLFIIWKTFTIVHMREAVVKERVGKFSGVLMPGFHFILPLFDRIAYRHEMREQVLDVPSQTCITKDNIQVEVDGIVYLRVLDPEKASYGIENYRRASVNLAQTTMRSEIGKISLENCFSERDSINESIVREIDKASDPWGVKVLRYEIKNITPSAHVIDTLEKQMEAEREKRSKIILANAEKEARINASEGERQEAVNISEGKKQERINEAIGRAKEISILADATAQGITMVAESVSGPGGDDAVKLRIVEQFIDELGNIFQNSSVSVVPPQLANIKGFFEGIDRISGSMKHVEPKE